VNDQRVIIYPDQNLGQRLDKYLVEHLPGYSRNRIQMLIKAGHVWVDGRPIQKAGFLLESHASVEIHLPQAESSSLTPEAIPLEVVFENADLLVVNKPPKMVVHPAAGHTSGTLVHAALAHSPDIQGVSGTQRPGVVHRLDKDTSGLILLAKNDQAQHWLQEQFNQRQVDKTYLALVDGRPPTPSGRIEAPIGRDPAHRKKMAVVPQHKGRQAISEYRTQETFTHHTYLEVHPITGRTHQIRLHMAFLGCPVAGDTIYGRRKPTIPLDRHFLHAYRLRLRLPNENQLHEFIAPLPEDLENTLAWLRSEAALQPNR